MIYHGNVSSGYLDGPSGSCNVSFLWRSSFLFDLALWPFLFQWRFASPPPQACTLLTLSLRIHRGALEGVGRKSACSRVLCIRPDLACTGPPTDRSRAAQRTSGFPSLPELLFKASLHTLFLGSLVPSASLFVVFRSFNPPSRESSPRWVFVSSPMGRLLQRYTVSLLGCATFADLTDCAVAAGARGQATTAMITEPVTGITFATAQFDADSVPGGLTFGYALPPNAATTDATEYIGYLVDSSSRVHGSKVLT